MQEKEMTDISGYIGSKEYKKELKYWSELVKSTESIPGFSM